MQPREPNLKFIHRMAKRACVHRICHLHCHQTWADLGWLKVHFARRSSLSVASMAWASSVTLTCGDYGFKMPCNKSGFRSARFTGLPIQQIFSRRGCRFMTSRSTLMLSTPSSAASELNFVICIACRSRAKREAARVRGGVGIQYPSPLNLVFVNHLYWQAGCARRWSLRPFINAVALRGGRQ